MFEAMLRGLLKRSRTRQRRRQRFLQGLSIERLESRQLLYGVTDTPHGAPPSHDLGDTIQADVLIYSNGSLIDLPANLGITSGGDSAFVTTSAAGSTVSISPADVDGDDVIDTPSQYITVGDIFETCLLYTSDAADE